MYKSAGGAEVSARRYKYPVAYVKALDHFIIRELEDDPREHAVYVEVVGLVDYANSDGDFLTIVQAWSRDRDGFTSRHHVFKVLRREIVKMKVVGYVYFDRPVIQRDGGEA